MRFVMFYHSLVSDWNHGNAHFLRGIASELGARGHDVVVLEPEEGWSRRNLLVDHGPDAVAAFQRRYPHLRSQVYCLERLDLAAALDGADVVMVHEWNEPALVAAVGAHRARHRYRLLFHDTHHRAVSEPATLGRFDLSHYDAALVFGRVLERVYRDNGWCRRVFTWHEAADVRVFAPQPPHGNACDVVWVGNWGDGERGDELEEFLLEPVRRLGLRARVYGVRYPPEGLQALARAGIEYCGYLPNFEVPRIFAAARVTVHVPRRFYSQVLDGIPTIRPFEAMACAVPLVSAPWNDSEGLFATGRDFLVARDGREMRRHLAHLLAHPAHACELAAHGLRTIRARHTCGHRVDELLRILSWNPGTVPDLPRCNPPGQARRVATRLARLHHQPEARPPWQESAS